MAVPITIEEAHELASARLIDARGSIREAFDRLDTGVRFDDLIRYIERDFHAKALTGGLTLEQLHARLVGLVARAAITIVESDRMNRWHEETA